MKYFTKICSILTIMAIIICLSSCNNTDNTISNNTNNTQSTVESVNTTENTNSTASVKKTVTYRVYVNDTFKETSIDTIMTDNNGFLPKEFGESSFKINAYTYIDSTGNPITGDLIIAENTTDKLNALNKFTANDDFTEATFTSDIETESNNYNTINIGTKVNDSGEICILLDADNVIAIEE